MKGTECLPAQSTFLPHGNVLFYLFCAVLYCALGCKVGGVHSLFFCPLSYEFNLHPKRCTSPEGYIVNILSAQTSSPTINTFSNNQEKGFTENAGQIVDASGKKCNDIIALIDIGDGVKAYLRKTGISYVVSKSNKNNTVASLYQNSTIANLTNIQTTIQRINMEFVNANPQVTYQKQSLLNSVVNYYYANCGNGITNVKSYKQITYQNIYPNIDLVFNVKQEGGLEYDFIVNPGGNVNDIKLKYTGASNLSVSEKNKLSIGTFESKMEESIPSTYQMVNDAKKQSVVCNYQLNANTISFSVANYDKTKALIIDPWITYLGGTNADGNNGYVVIDCDVNNNLVVSGRTSSSNFPVLSGIQMFHAGSYDIFVSKFTNSGNLLWSTYYGGSDDNGSTGMVIDNNQDIILVGWTSDNNLPLSAGAYQTTGLSFVIKLNASGNRVWATRYGGPTSYALSVTVDSNNNLFIGGSGDIPATPGAFQTGNVVNPAFLSKCSSVNGAPIWTTLIGSNSGQNWAYNIAADINDDIFLFGVTTSNTFPITAGCFQTKNASGLGGKDCFAGKFSNSGSCMWLTYFGGTADDAAFINNITTDQSGNLMVSGYTQSNNFPFTTGVYQTSSKGSYEGFVAKFSSSGSLTWSTYCGGSGFEIVYGMDVDDNGNIAISGLTNSGNFPATAGAFQTSKKGQNNAFLTKFDINGKLLCSSYIGGTSIDEAYDLVIDSNHNINIVGQVNSSDFPVTSNAFQTIYKGNADAFVVQLSDMCKMTICTLTPTVILTSNASCNDDGSASATASLGSSPYSYLWSNGQTLSTATGLSAGVYLLKITDASGCTANTTISIGSNTTFTITIATTDCTCGKDNGTATVDVSGGTPLYTYSWNNVNSNNSISNLSIGDYTLVVTDASGCSQISIVNISNIPFGTVSITVNTSIKCNGDANGVITGTMLGGSNPYTYVWNNGSSEQTISNLIAGTYSLQITDNKGCIGTHTLNLTEPSAIVLIMANISDTCSQSKGLASVTASGGAGTYSYLWNTNSTDQQLTNLSIGTYSVLVTDVNGCTKSISANVNDVNTAIADAGIDVTINKGETIQLTASGGGTYSWSPLTGLDNSSISNPIANPTITTTYTLLITDNNGCTATDELTITVETPCVNNEVYIPNSFSPNGDGINDLLYVRGNCIENMLFTVYNRWGEKIFESNDITKAWDGTYNNQPMGTGVYAYYIEAVLKSKDIVNNKGNISLIR